MLLLMSISDKNVHYSYVLYSYALNCVHSPLCGSPSHLDLVAIPTHIPMAAITAKTRNNPPTTMKEMAHAGNNNGPMLIKSMLSMSVAFEGPVTFEEIVSMSVEVTLFIWPLPMADR